MSPVLVLTRAVYDAILDHATEAAPREACGVLAGSRGAGEPPGIATASSVHPTANASETPRVRYEIDPEELLSVVDRIETSGDEVVGFYHSHPAGPASPSDTDHREATWVDHHYVIVSLAGRMPTLGAWTWTGERFDRDAVSVRPGTRSVRRFGSRRD